jgi:hypothetical protein
MTQSTRLMTVILAIGGLASGCAADRTSAPEAASPLGASPAAPAPAPSEDSVAMWSMSPEPGTVVRRGSMVTVSATAQCTLASADSGEVVLYSLDGAGEYQRLGLQTVSGKGTRFVTLSSSIQVPASGPIWVIVALYVNGQSGAHMSAGGQYRID